MIAFEPLGVVVDAQAALQAVGFQLIALAAGERTGMWNPDGNQRQPRCTEAALGEQTLHWMHWRDTPVRLIDAVAAHGFGIRQTDERSFHLESGYLADALHQRFDHLEDALFLWE